jgi:hypothetical protein
MKSLSLAAALAFAAADAAGHHQVLGPVRRVPAICRPWFWAEERLCRKRRSNSVLHATVGI